MSSRSTYGKPASEFRIEKPEATREPRLSRVARWRILRSVWVGSVGMDYAGDFMTRARRSADGQGAHEQRRSEPASSAVRGALRVAAAVVALAFGQGCFATTRVLESATGHYRYGPRRGFSFVVRHAFLLSDGNVLLYAQDAGLPAIVKTRGVFTGDDAWVMLIRAEQLPLRNPSGEPLALEWRNWKHAREPQNRVFVPAAGAPPDTPPSVEDVEACSFVGGLRRIARPLTVLAPGEPDVPGEPSVQALRAAEIVPKGSRAVPAEPQLALRHLPPEALGGDVGAELRVSFLADETQPQPASLFFLPFSAAFDAFIIGGGVALGVPYFGIKAAVGGVKWLIPGESEAQRRILERASEMGCRCVTTLYFGEGVTERPACYKPYWD
jgi:hypothetical protein